MPAIIKRKNASGINHDYKLGDKVLLKIPGKHLRIRVNIRRLFPYFVHTDH
jgi:hypothetical protein